MKTQYTHTHSQLDFHLESYLERTKYKTFFNFFLLFHFVVLLLRFLWKVNNTLRILSLWLLRRSVRLRKVIFFSCLVVCHSQFETRFETVGNDYGSKGKNKIREEREFTQIWQVVVVALAEKKR